MGKFRYEVEYEDGIFVLCEDWDIVMYVSNKHPVKNIKTLDGSMLTSEQQSLLP